MEPDMLQLIEKLGVTMELPRLRDEEVKGAQYFLIRHGYSEYNFKDAMLKAEHGEESKEHQALKLDDSMLDPGLHEIGVKQCESN